MLRHILVACFPLLFAQIAYIKIGCSQAAVFALLSPSPSLFHSAGFALPDASLSSRPSCLLPLLGCPCCLTTSSIRQLLQHIVELAVLLSMAGLMKELRQSSGCMSFVQASNHSKSLPCLVQEPCSLQQHQ